MRTTELGRDGPQVSTICFGAWPIGGGLGTVDEAQGIATVRAALDAGMTFIDTAEGYQTSEVVVGKGIAGRRDEVFLATKLSGNDHSLDHMRKAIETSLRALGTDYIDLYQLHSPQPQWPIEQTMEGLIKLQDEGKIRYIGVSNYSPEQTTEALRHGPIYSSQPRYNMFFRDEKPALEFCEENGIGVIPHSVLSKGLLTRKYGSGHTFAPDDERRLFNFFKGDLFDRAQVITKSLSDWANDHGRDLTQLAIAWVMAQPGVSSPIVGAKSVEQVLHNASAADWVLSDSDLVEIEVIIGDFRPVWIKDTE